MTTHSYEELAALHAIAKTLAQPWELRDQLEQVLGELSSRLGMKRGMISLLDRDTGEAWLEVAHGIKLDGLEITYRIGEGITGKVAQTGLPLAVPNLGKERLFLDRTGARRHLDRNALSFLCVPIMYDSRVVGILSADKGTQEVTDLDREMAILSSVAELIAKAVHILGLEEENRRLRRLVNSQRPPSLDIIGHSKGMQEVFGLIRHVADSGTTVLILGETGTGKELIAKAIHVNSGRSKGPLVQVNCAAIPDTLIESELFGHEKGAFTGALRQHRGRFEEANNGSIFLDEVAELSAAAQAKLLRVLQEKRFQPLGSPRLDERLLYRVERRPARHPLDREHGRPVEPLRRQDAALFRDTVDDDRAGAAGGVVAAAFRPGKAERLAKDIDRLLPPLELHAPRRAVDGEGYPLCHG